MESQMNMNCAIDSQKTVLKRMMNTYQKAIIEATTDEQIDHAFDCYSVCNQQLKELNQKISELIKSLAKGDNLVGKLSSDHEQNRKAQSK